jgi:hypothetical protein
MDAKRGDQMDTPQPNEKVRFLKILGALVIIVIAASSAFFVTCFGGFFAGSALGPSGEAGIGWAFTVGIIAGGVAALAVVGGLVWLFWLRPRKKTVDKNGIAGRWE